MEDLTVKFFDTFGIFILSFQEEIGFISHSS